MDKESLAHSAWNCKYHIVFAPKYRRQAIYGTIKADIGKILRMLCQRNRNNRSGMLQGPYAHARENPAEAQRVVNRPSLITA